MTRKRPLAYSLHAPSGFQQGVRAVADHVHWGQRLESVLLRDGERPVNLSELSPEALLALYDEDLTAPQAAKVIFERLGVPRNQRAQEHEALLEAHFDALEKGEPTDAIKEQLVTFHMR